MAYSRRRLTRPSLVLVGVWVGHARPALAGMPSYTLTDLARMRFEAISFFVVVLLGAAWGIKGIWNGLRRDLPGLPRLTYRAALGLTTLWGLLFLLVLSMISGARELMTPGAWTRKPDGVTYTLAETPRPARALTHPTDDEPLWPRRAGLLRLHARLLQYAIDHHGAFPPDLDDPVLADAYRFDPEVPGAQLVYIPGQARWSTGQPARPLVLEPDVFPNGQRLVLMNNGDISAMNTAEIQALLAEPEARP